MIDGDYDKYLDDCRAKVYDGESDTCEHGLKRVLTTNDLSLEKDEDWYYCDYCDMFIFQGDTNFEELDSLPEGIKEISEEESCKLWETKWENEKGK